MNSLIIVCAGRGTRFGTPQNKLLTDVGGRPLIWLTLHHALQSLFLDEIILVIRKEELPAFQKVLDTLPKSRPIRFVWGGATRMESVANGLAAVSCHSSTVLVHDGARPGVDGPAFDRLIAEISDETPAVLYGLPSADTVKVVDSRGFVVRTPDRASLVRAQTPQGIRTSVFRRCMKEAIQRHLAVTDDASICEACGVPVKWILGKEAYFKVTVPEDKEKLEQGTLASALQIRVGQGYDIHRFDETRPLIIGGVRLRDTGGLLGHSDADVLLHAIMDALLGAAGCQDIGHYFPDTDDRWLGASSLKLLEEVGHIVAGHGYGIGNIDSTVLAEAPKMAPHISLMRDNIAKALQISKDQVSVKATTNETLGAIGRKEGIAALASALLVKR